MTSIVRGSTLFVDVVFKDQDGATINPSTAELRIAYTIAGASEIEEIDLTGNAGTWSASWDSSPADAGIAYWFAHADGSPTAAVQGQVIVLANAANPQAS